MALLGDPALLTKLGEDHPGPGLRRRPAFTEVALPRAHQPAHGTPHERAYRRSQQCRQDLPHGIGRGLLSAVATYAIGAMSERALVYTDADFQHRHLLISEAAAIHREGIGALIVRSVIWGNQPGVRDHRAGRGRVLGARRRISKPGPTGLITTSVKGIESELETRLLTPDRAR